MGSTVVATSVGPKQVKIAAQHVVITSSLGALKASELCFDPPLPESKEMAIQRLGFGTVDKVDGCRFDVGNQLDTSGSKWISWTPEILKLKGQSIADTDPNESNQV